MQWCHGKEAGAPGPGEHRLDVEADMMTMRSYHQTRMRVPAILAVLAMILVFAGCGGRVVSVACDAGVQYGLQRATAYRLAAKMVEGVGALYMATGTHPGAMKDAVCSPGGTTIRGVAKLEKDGFRGAVIDAVDAIVG